MDCRVAREALSARMDGEREPVPSARTDEHLAQCEACRQWRTAATQQSEQLRRLAGAVRPPLTVAPASRQRRRVAVRFSLRWALAAVGVLQIGLAVVQGLGVDVGLGAGHHGMTGGHVVNESTAWSAALGLVMLAAAARPVLAAGLALVLAVYAATLAVYVVTDLAADNVTVARIVTHLPAVLGAVLAAAVHRRHSRPPTPEATAGPSTVAPLPDRTTRRQPWPTDGAA